MKFKVGDKVEVINVGSLAPQAYKQQTIIIKIGTYSCLPEYTNVVKLKINGYENIYRLRDSDLRLIDPQMVFEFMYE